MSLKKFKKELLERIKGKPEHINSEKIMQLVVDAVVKNKNAHVVSNGMNLEKGISDIEMNYAGMDFDVMIFPRSFWDEKKALKEIELGVTRH